ncbi:hypothetical protein NQZ68_014281 [Dissostichus eleginoides]|nr:hypothetical protein NQZ68_014281 [Dissostichus eleginoides]
MVNNLIDIVTSKPTATEKSSGSCMLGGHESALTLKSHSINLGAFGPNEPVESVKVGQPPNRHTGFNHADLNLCRRGTPPIEGMHSDDHRYLGDIIPAPHISFIENRSDAS